MIRIMKFNEHATLMDGMFNKYSELSSQIDQMIPMVRDFIKSNNFQIDLNSNSLKLLALASIIIKKYNETGDIKLRDDSKNILAELKLMGIGNGIVEDFVNYLSGGEKIKRVDQPRHRNR